eukprot:766939-Hanusia_phi.AAC.10
MATLNRAIPFYHVCTLRIPALLVLVLVLVLLHLQQHHVLLASTLPSAFMMTSLRPLPKGR